MSRKRIWLGLLATVMMAGGASAATMGTQVTQYVAGIDLTDTLNGNWGVTNPLTSTTSLPATWVPTQGTFLVDDGSISPGGGGQDFDIEAFYTGYDVTNSTLYVTMVTGFNLQGEWAGVSPYNYFVGDVFLDFGLDGWDLAFDLSELSLDTAAGRATDANVAPTTIDAYTGNPVGGSNVPNGYVSSSPYRISSGTAETDVVDFSYFRGSDTNSTNVANVNPATDHNVYNFAYDMTGKDDWIDEIFNAGSGGNGFRMHWTMSCGNDLNDMDTPPLDGPPPRDPVVPVPAAAPLAMLGMAIVGLASRSRRAKC